MLKTTTTKRSTITKNVTTEDGIYIATFTYSVNDGEEVGTPTQSIINNELFQTNVREVANMYIEFIQEMYGLSL